MTCCDLLFRTSIASNKVLQAENALMHIHGFDFTLKGVLPVWEGFSPLSRLSMDQPSSSTQWQPTQRGRRTSSALSATAPRGVTDKKFGNYVAAVEWLNKRNTDSRVEPMTLPASSKKHAQRQLGLSLVGWNLSDGEMELQISEYASILFDRPSTKFFKVGTSWFCCTGGVLGSIYGQD